MQANDAEVHITRGRWDERRWGPKPADMPPGNLYTYMYARYVCMHARYICVYDVNLHIST